MLNSLPLRTADPDAALAGFHRSSADAGDFRGGINILYSMFLTPSSSVAVAVLVLTIVWIVQYQFVLVLTLQSDTNI